MVPAPPAGPLSVGLALSPRLTWISLALAHGPAHHRAAAIRLSAANHRMASQSISGTGSCWMGAENPSSRPLGQWHLADSEGRKEMEWRGVKVWIGIFIIPYNCGYQGVSAPSSTKRWKRRGTAGSRGVVMSRELPSPTHTGPGSCQAPSARVGELWT